jgi:hypothetical protein
MTQLAPRPESPVLPALGPGRRLALRALVLGLRFMVRGVLPRLPARTVRGLGRTLFSRSWARFQRATRDPLAAQLETLFAVLHRNRLTTFGEQHGFARIATLDDFRRQVPIRDWDALAPWVDRVVRGERRVLTIDDPLFFGRTSGTTGPAKLVPVTPSYLEEFRRSRRVWMRQVIDTLPGIVRGHVLTVHSPRIEGRTPGGVPYGSITAVFGQRSEAAQRLADALERSPLGIHLLEDFEAKYYLILRQALSQRVSIIAAVNPSTVVLLCRKLTEHAALLARDVEAGTLRDDLPVPAPLRAALLARYRPDRRTATRLRASLDRRGYVHPRDVWPDLCAAMCWKGGSAPFYLQQLPRWFDDLPVMDYGFLATEGSFSIPMDASGNDGVLAVQGHFMEFVPHEDFESSAFDPTATLTADQLRVGERYRIVITGSHGLYRYDINDVVEVTGTYGAAPRVRFVHKGGRVASITGEKVTEAQVVHAVTAAAARAGVALHGFAVTFDLTDPPAYRFVVEPASPERLAGDAAACGALLQACDAALMAENIEYAAKRKSQRLAAPTLWVVPAGSFDAERAGRVAAGAPDAHVKPSHLAPDAAALAALRPLHVHPATSAGDAA